MGMSEYYSEDFTQTSYRYRKALLQMFSSMLLQRHINKYEMNHH